LRVESLFLFRTPVHNGRVSVHDPGAGSDEFPVEDIALQLACPRCSAVAEFSFPLLTDWRDRRRLEALSTCYPSVPCASCGEPITVPSPVVVLRPGDPIAVLFCATDADPALMDAFSTALRRHAADEHGVIQGPVASTDPDLVSLVAERYTGFQLLRLAADGQDWATSDDVRVWITFMRENHDWPDITAAVGAYVRAESAEDRLAVYEREVALSDVAWEPVVRWIGSLLVERQQTPQAAGAVRERLRRLARQRLFGAELDRSPGAAEVVAQLERLTSLQSTPNRSVDDVRLGIDMGKALIKLTAKEYGPVHPVSLTAVNDTAALMLDDAANAETMTPQARELLTAARAVALRHRLPAVADATTNLALAHLRVDRISDSDDAEAAIILLRDALHLQRLYNPAEPGRALSAIANLASLTRSRLAGDPASNTAEAITLFESAREIDAGRLLTLPDRLTLEANLLSALADRAGQHHDGRHDADVVRAIEALEPQLAALAPGHSVRVRTLTNFGSITLDLLYKDSDALPDGFTERALGWLRDAHEQTAQLPVADAARVLAAATLAALYFQLGGAENLPRARALLAESVAALAESRSTRLHHTVYENFARLQLASGDWDTAIEFFEAACAHADAVIERASTPRTRLAQIAAAGDLYQRLAMLHAHRRDARSAIHAVERARSRWGGKVRAYDADALDQAVRSRLRDAGALLYTGTCNLGSYAVMLVVGTGAGAWSITPSTADLAPLLATVAGTSRIQTIGRVLDRAAAELGPGLVDQCTRILSAANATRLSIIASGALAGLPVGALPGSDGSLSDHATVEYLISARAADEPTASETTASQPSRRAVAVIESSAILPYAASDLTALRRYAPDVATPPPGAGIRGWLLDQLHEATHLHLACNATYDPKDPFASRFKLDRDLALTVADLAGVSTPNLSIVVASCCRTGVIDQRGADGLVGLAQALIAAGSASAIATLWAVDDAGTSLMMAKFYDELAAATPAAEAIADAQRCLRETTMAEWQSLAQADNDASWVPAQLRGGLLALADSTDPRDVGGRPFAHPMHWAGVVYISA
jgi:CHAT domain-containing protein